MDRGQWTRRYPPLLVIAAAVVLALFALPSALNLPQANPGQLAEYAPVPGAAGQQAGNFAALGLGQGGSALGSLPGGSPAGLGGQAAPSDYACVGSPPRQTEDLLSPPCEPSFRGDNGGATYTGVSGSQITVLFRMDAPQDFVYTRGTGPPTGYYDMENPNDVSQFFEFPYLRDWEIYFNRRYQTYHRRVHFWVHNFSQPQTQSSYGPSDAQAEAADNWSRLHPFATLQNRNFEPGGDFPIDYANYMADKGALAFGSYEFTQAQATKYPGLFWSYPPSLDSQAQEYASFVCQRIAKPGVVTFSGNGDIGKPRKYGLLLTDDPNASVTQRRQQLSVQDLKQDCGIQFADTKYFHYSDAETTGPKSGWGTTDVAAFRADGITTIIWPGGGEVEDMTSASQARWYPEWVMEGDGYLDSNGGAGQEPLDEMGHAWVTTPATLIDNSAQVEPACMQAILEVDPKVSNDVSGLVFACLYYDDLRQLFTGIQLAGPHLTPQSMDVGFHAIPPKPSTSPYEPSCYYLPGDYTCVKDAAAEWFDPNARPSGSQIGCWRMWRNGQRYLVGGWPRGDATQGVTASDVCNLYDPGYSGYAVSTS